MTTKSKKVANMLFGRHELANDDGLCVQNSFTHPDGTNIVWPGNDGLVFTFYKKILELEKKIAALESKKK